jgi:hypothetical protein
VKHGTSEKSTRRHADLDSMLVGTAQGNVGYNRVVVAMYNREKTQIWAPQMQITGAQYMWVGYCEEWHVRNGGGDHDDMETTVCGRARQHNERVAMWRCRAWMAGAHVKTE